MSGTPFWASHKERCSSRGLTPDKPPQTEGQEQGNPFTVARGEKIIKKKYAKNFPLPFPRYQLVASSLRISAPGTRPARASQRLPEHRICQARVLFYNFHCAPAGGGKHRESPGRAKPKNHALPSRKMGWGTALFCCLGFIRPVLPGTKPYTNAVETSFSSEQETMLLIPVLPSGGLHPLQPVLCPARPSPQLQGLSQHFNPPSFIQFSALPLPKSLSSSQLTLLQLTTALPSLPLSALLPPRGTPVTLSQHPKAAAINQTPFPGHQLLC